MKRFRALLSYAVSLVRAHPRAALVVCVLVFAVLVILFSGAGKDTEQTSIVVSPKGFLQQVSVSGKVVAAHDVSLAFEETGRVASVLVDEGSMVAEGEPLIFLDSGTLTADLSAAEADVAVKRVELENRNVNLEKVKKEQDTLVGSAARTLLSEGLSAVPFSGIYDLSPPTISGVYKGEETGTYKVTVNRTYPGSSDMNLRVYDIERGGPYAVPKDEPAPLGTRGLYISFPDGPEEYDGTTWYVSVPNVKSSSYLANFNAYQEAVRARDTAIAEAEAELSERSVGQTIARAELQKAEAEVARIRAELAKRSLRAPFAGVVTAVSVAPGEAVSSGSAAVSLISSGELELESFVPEINISYLSVGDEATVTLDAYGVDVPFFATVVAIDPAETIRDGVSTYRVLLHFSGNDERIRSGMTANIVITTDKRDGVISVPQGAVMKENGKNIVTVLEGGKKRERIVTLGTVSSLGEVEIVSGLFAGDEVLISR